MATAKLRLDTRPKNNGLHNVKVAVYHKSDKKFFGTTIDISKADFNQVNEAIKGNINLRKDDKIRVKDILKERIEEAQAICEKLGNRFSFNSFTELYTDTRVKNDSLEYLFDLLIESKYKADKVGTAKSYNNAKQSLLKFSPKATIQDVTTSYLEKYERYMKSKSKSRSSIGIYLRALRAVYNQAIQNNLVDSSDYPFGKGKYQIPAPKGRKIALEAEELLKLSEYQPISEAEEKALDFFWISYYANGINFKDIVLLKQSNIFKGQISFIREKTKDSDPQIIHVEITERLAELLAKYRKYNISEDTFIFDIVSENDDLITQNNKLRQFIKTTNKYLKRISKKLELSEKVTTYVARHSFATVALRQGLSISEIQESMGHSTENTTRNYLGGFSREKRKENAQKVADFKSLVNG
ncbi:MAG: site-specific integrase [Cytophagia bacterium]|nr:site-specific integrase [Cytophagia bacterium]